MGFVPINQGVFPRALLLSTLAFLAAGCISSEEPQSQVSTQIATEPVIEAPACSVAFSRAFSPVKIDGWKHLYFDSADLAFFLRSSVQVQDIALQVTLRGDRRGDSPGPTLSLNGIEAYSADHFPFYRVNGFSSGSDSSDSEFKLAKLRLNGAEPIEKALVRVLENKGQVRLTLQGRDLKILAASIVVTGRDLGQCGPQPTPEPTSTATPPPAPVAPRTMISAVEPSGSPVSSSNVAFTLASDQLDASFECSLDGAAATPCASPQVYSGLSNGAHVFVVKAINSAGLSDPVGASYSWSVDSVAPSVTLLNAGLLPSVTSATSLSLEFAAADASAVIFNCRLDGGLAFECASPLALSGLGEGIHVVSVSAIDAAGNPSAPASFQWSVDLTPPNTHILLAEPRESITPSMSLELTFGANETASFECSVDQGGFRSCLSPLSLLGLLDGEHAVEIRATDLAGNTGAVATYSWSVDSVAPAIALGAVLPESGITNSRNISVEFSAGEPASFSCSLDGAPAEACVSPFSSVLFSEGNHELVIQAVDLAGNAAAAARVAWIMDFTLPALSWGLISPSAASFISSSSLQAEVLSPEAVTLQSFLNSVSVAQTASPIVLSDLAEGAYSLAVSGTDRAGNVGSPLLHDFTVDLTAPALSLSAARSGLTRETVNTFEFAANEPASFECDLDGAGFAACTSPLSFAGLAEGEHLFSVRAIDAAGNQSAVSVVSWSVDYTAPITVISASRSGNASISFSFAANEPVSGFECALDGQAFAACASPVAFSGLANGSHSFAVRATDLTGNLESSPASFAWVVEPVITTRITSVTPAGSLTNLASISFAFSSNVADASFECSLDGAAFAVCASPKAYSGLLDGNHSFTVRAVDRWGAVDATGASHSWKIDRVAPIVTISPSRTQNANITFGFTANEAVSGFQCALDAQAFASCSPPRTYTGLPVGFHTFSVRATDLAGNVSAAATYSWTVDPPIATSITSVTPAGAFVNSSSISIAFASNQASGSTFHCSRDGAAATPCTSPVSYSGLLDGTHSFVVRAIDNWGMADMVGASYSWTIDSAAPVVVSFLPVGGSFSVTVNWTTSEPATSKINWGLGLDTSRVVAEDANYVTNHSVKITGLSAGTNYSFIVSGHDRAGNAYTSAKKTVKTF
ncbi:MAG: hypothetical protein NDJ89_12735 [Oligoflexia bacterium]|nr:hypothetical protein [Oligoflexia bacterium]